MKAMSNIVDSSMQSAPNATQPRARRWRNLLGVMFLALPLILAGCQETTTEDRNTALQELNYDRIANNLPALRLDDTLNAKADEWAKHLRDTCTLSHSVLQEDLGTLNWRAVGENVGYGPTIASVQNAFMNSANHRATILTPGYEIVGLGVVHGTCNGNARTYVVQVFVDLQ
jgi:uncharacterized protein YkwD